MITQFKRAKIYKHSDLRHNAYVLPHTVCKQRCCEETDVTRISDYSTMNEWKNYFGYDIKSTKMREVCGQIKPF